MQGKIEKRKVVILSGILLAVIVAAIFAVRMNADHSREIDVSKIKNGKEILTYEIETVEPCSHSVETPQVKDDIDSPYWTIRGNGNYQDYIDIRGWSLKRNESIELFHTSVVLRETTPGGKVRYLELKTQSAPREDITKKFSEDGCDYAYSGFLATIKAEKLAPENQYEVCILYMNNDEEYFVRTGQKINR